MNLYEIRPFPKPMGVEVGLSWAQICALLHLVEEFRVRNFVELGLWKGGIGTLFGFKTLINDFVYHGFDIHNVLDKRYENAMNELKPRPHVHFHLGDLKSPEIQGLVYSVIRSMPGICLLFCDNGDKPWEVKTFAPMLRPGDLLVTHDYGTEIFDKDLEFLIHPLWDEIEIEPMVSYREALKLPVYQRAMYYAVLESDVMEDVAYV